MGVLDQIMKYTITADASKAKAEINSVDKAFLKLGGSATPLQQGFKNAASEASNLVSIFTGNKLTGITSQLTSFSGAIGAIPGPTGLAIGAVAGLGAASAAAAVGLYKLTESASEYGSIIHDTSQKTGLGAETISALKIAADQSSSSLESISGGLSKYNKLVGNAAAGSEEAGKKLKSLGETPKEALNDLDGSLGRVFKRIVDAGTAAEQTRIATTAFGKAGADLIPTILSFDGDLPGLISHMKELGLTMSDQDAAAADAFGDQMDTLKAQISAAARTIGMEMMPVFQGFAEDLSNWLKNNKGEVREWGEVFVKILKQVGLAAQELRNDWEMTKLAGEYFTNSGMTDPAWYEDWQKRSAKLEQEKQVIYAKIQNNLNNTEAGSGSWVQPDDYADYKAGKLPYPKAPTIDHSGDDTGGGKTAKAKKEHVLSPQAKSIISHANDLGISPLDLATLMLYETSGTLSTSIKGGKGGKYTGLIQFGQSEMKAYGAKAGQPFDKQMDAVNRYLRARGVGPGDDLLTLYKAVNGGNVNVSANASDGNGTIAQHVARMLAKNRGAAMGLLKGGDKADQWGDLVAALAKKAQEQIDKTLKTEEAAARRRVEISAATSKDIISNYQDEFKAAVATYDPETAIMASELIARTQRKQIDAEIAALKDRLNFVKSGSEEEKDLLTQITIKEIEAGEAQKRIDDERSNRWNEISSIYQAEIAYQLSLKQIEEDRLKMLQETYGLAHTNFQPDGAFDAQGNPIKKVPGGTGHETNRGTDLFGDDGIAKIKDAADIYMGTVNDMKSMSNEAFSSMAEGVGSMVENWVLYGDAGPDALRKMTAATLAHLAQQAAVEAVMETARGFASLAIWDLDGATKHFISAGVFASIGVGAALGGRAAAGDLFNGKGGKAGGSTGSAYSGSSSSSQANTEPFSRSSSGSYMSGRDVALDRLNATVDALHQKIASMTPGEVLRVASRQDPGIIGRQAVRDVANNHSIGKDLIRTIGVKG